MWRKSKEKKENNVFSKIIPGNILGYYKTEGFASITLSGTLKENSFIDKYNVGCLKITGKVEENVIFVMNAPGNLIFERRPPQSVLDAVEWRSIGSVIISEDLSAEDAHLFLTKLQK